MYKTQLNNVMPFNMSFAFAHVCVHLSTPWHVLCHPMAQLATLAFGSLIDSAVHEDAIGVWLTKTSPCTIACD